MIEVILVRLKKGLKLATQDFHNFTLVNDTFVGLHDSVHEGRFKWFDGLRFKPGVCVPVHANGGNMENCVAWSIEKPQGCWEDRPCNEKIPFTCKIPVEGKEYSCATCE